MISPVTHLIPVYFVSDFWKLVIISARRTGRCYGRLYTHIAKASIFRSETP